MALAPLRVSEAADSLAKASSPEPFSSSKTSNWVARGGGLPAYIQHIAHDLMEKRGKSESNAIQMAIGIVKRWARGGGNVDSGTRAAAAKAVAEWERLKAGSHAKSAVQHSAIEPSFADELTLREAALERIYVLEQAVGAPALAGLFALEPLQEALAAFSPTLKRVASSTDELERHDVYDGDDQVGTVSKQRAYGPSEPVRHRAYAVNGDRLGGYAHPTQAAAIDAIRTHLEEAPARVIALPAAGKFLVAKPASYSGQTTYTQFPNEQAARHAAGLPAVATSIERASKVQAVTETLEFDLMTVSGLDIPPLRRVQEARCSGPLGEAFHADELRNFRGEWRSGGGHLAKLLPTSVPSVSRGRHKPSGSDASARYEGGVVRASARARAAHARKPQIAPKQRKNKPKMFTLADAVGSGAWSPSARKATRTLKAQRPLEGDALVKAVAAGTATDTEHLHRVRNPDGSLGAYTPERQALHEQIIQNMLQGKGVHEGSAQAIFTAGGPASGKSGLVKTGDSEFERKIGKDSTVAMPPDVVHADPDIVRTQLPEYQDLVKAGRLDASSLTHEEASHLTKVLTRIALARQHHILVDGVGDSGPRKFAKKIEDAQRAGHKVSVHYATTDVETALKRAEKRAEEEGRAVPEDYLRASHRDVSRRFMEDVSKLKGIHLRVVDTTDQPNKVIAEQLPADDKLSIKDGELFRRFLLKGK